MYFGIFEMVDLERIFSKKTALLRKLAKVKFLANLFAHKFVLVKYSQKNRFLGKI
jgi:hypothetical protein